jgi:hypothetical protein
VSLFLTLETGDMAEVLMLPGELIACPFSVH